jgi:hypothetical protein
MIVGSALGPCCVTLRPRASHQTALTIFHPCTSFRTLSITYAMMGSRTSMEPKHQVRRPQGRFPAVMEKYLALRNDALLYNGLQGVCENDSFTRHREHAAHSG